MNNADRYFELCNRLNELEKQQNELTKQIHFLLIEKEKLESKLKENIDSENNILKIPNNENFVIFLNRQSVELLKLKQI